MAPACIADHYLWTVLIVVYTLCSDLTERHRRLAEITEMIHTASLVHDDVLDDCAIRRGMLL